jgi:cellulose synthase (UDP-forming)
MLDLNPWTPLLTASGALLLLFFALGRTSPLARALGASLCIFMAMRYLYWRIAFSLPTDQNLLQTAWVWIFLAVECATVFSAILLQFFLSRTIDRGAVADARRMSPLRNAPTDVLIATCNEDRAILERTIVGALAIHHPDLRVWVLDDGARPWVAELAAELGAHYVSRIKGKHAKAGNVNNGLQNALRTGRRPEFILMLDADFIPNRRILQRTLCLFEESDVGMVQTPQHFFNPDPVQSNLLCSRVWPDEQRFFFNVLMPGKDAWGAAFCCGTSCVSRVAALEACGGIATETVTEDMLTSFKLEQHGYRTIFLNEQLSLGLAPEGLREFASQRARWCLGAMQQLFTPWSFFTTRRLSFINRLAFFDTVLYWMSGASFKLMALVAPVLFWLTGTCVIRASGAEILYWLVPFIATNLIFMSFITDNRLLPLMSDISQLLTSFLICRTVFTALLRPFGRPFEVTAKGISTDTVVVQWGLFLRFAGLAALTFAAVLLHLSIFSPRRTLEGYGATIFWSIVNITVLSLAALACVELPKRRKDERFQSSESAVLRLDGCIDLDCNLQDISLGGAMVVRSDGWRNLAGPAALLLDGGTLAVPIGVARREGNVVALTFVPDDALRRALIVKLYTGNYDREVEKVNAAEVFTALAKALVH